MDKEGLKLEIELLEGNFRSKSQGVERKRHVDVLLAVHSEEVKMHLTAFIRANHPHWMIRQADDALEAYAQLEHKPADIIICEFCMPYLSGFGLMKKLCSHEVLKHIPMVMISAEPLKEVIDSCMSLLVDPFDTGELKSVLAQALDRSNTVI